MTVPRTFLHFHTFVWYIAKIGIGALRGIDYLRILMKPVVNIDELTYQSHSQGKFEGRYALIAEKIGAKQLGYNISICPPGKIVCPFHNHHNEEEMFFILEGEGLLRFGNEKYPLRKNDFIACPAGGREVAHQIINTGPTDLIYLAVSTTEQVEVAEYPDSDKIGVFSGKRGERVLRKLFKATSDVDYFEGEE